MNRPFFTIVTVAWNDAWALTKTARSVFCQAREDLEYIVVDGASGDGTAQHIEFWQEHGLIDRAIIEPDGGVYDAMNKGLAAASGEFICFLNAGDVFADDGVLSRVKRFLEREPLLDGVLGWGQLGDQLWASWDISPAFAMGSLGFCHQSLYLRRAIAQAEPFDSRPFKTDSDTLQLARVIASGGRIASLPEVLALRDAGVGLSANLDRTATSIADTLTTEYPDVGAQEADTIIAFRRRCEQVAETIELLRTSSGKTAEHLAIVTLDTLFLRQSEGIAPDLRHDIAMAALAALEKTRGRAGCEQAVETLLTRQRSRAELTLPVRRERTELQRLNQQFERETGSRLTVHADRDVERAEFIVSLTTFPKRISSVHFVIRSLLRQSLLPRKIILTLGSDEFPSPKWLPSQLLELQGEIFEIRFVDQTTHQYDKFLHHAAENDSRPLVLVDDDVIYVEHSLRHLIEGHARHPDCVVANRCHRMAFGTRGELLPYTEWEKETALPEPNYMLFPTGAGGVLYPPGFFDPELVANAHNCLRHAPYADDIWLKACAINKRISTFATELSAHTCWYERYTPTMAAGSLQFTNVDRGLNDMQMRAMMAWLDQVDPAWREVVDSVERERVAHG